MLYTTVSDRQYGQQLAGSTMAQMECLHTHIHRHTFRGILIHRLGLIRSITNDKLHQRLQSDPQHHGCSTNTSVWDINKDDSKEGNGKSVINSIQVKEKLESSGL